MDIQPEMADNLPVFMNPASLTPRRPLLSLVLLHMAAAGVCFAFFLIAPIVACLIFMAIGNDPGGRMFFPTFVVGIALFAVVITMVLGGAALLTDLLRRCYRVPLWLPPLAVFGLATGSCWLLADGAHPAVLAGVGGIVALAFIGHWAAVSTVWFLPRFLFRLFRVNQAPPENRHRSLNHRQP
ncbi:MAG: hypothetical protein ABIV39_04290 [Verrucomicrobiota bacterium]